jgi:hypothetical protein
VTAEEIEARAKAAGIAVSLLGLIAENDVARLLGITVRTMRRWRESDDGPEHVLINGRIWYGCAAIADHISRQRTKADI